MFATEEKMVNRCVKELLNIYEDSEIILEPTGLFGIPDIMLEKDEIICIEAKLKNWKRALVQAYKYRTFSKKSYVYMDEDYIKAPLENIDEFKKFNIGLASVSDSEIKVYFEPEKAEPFSYDLYEKASNAFLEKKHSLLGK